MTPTEGTLAPFCEAWHSWKRAACPGSPVALVGGCSLCKHHAAEERGREEWFAQLRYGPELAAPLDRDPEVRNR